MIECQFYERIFGARVQFHVNGGTGLVHLRLTAAWRRRDFDVPCCSQSRMSNAIKLSGRTFLAPHRGSCPKG